MIFINIIVFWQISALDLESINVKLYFTSSKYLVCFFLSLLIIFMVDVAFLTLLGRKVLGYVHIREGPNKVGFVGIFLPFRDAIKLLTGEQQGVVAAYLLPKKPCQYNGIIL